MTEIADDRSWWADVEHLRPGAAATVAAPSTALDQRPAPPGLADLDAGWDGASTGRPSGRRFEREEPDPAPLRRGRITGRGAAREAAPAEPVLRRADAASFADAMDLDGAFGAPARAAQSREIVLTGHLPAGEEEWIEDQLWDEPGATRRPAGRSRPAADLWDDDGDLWEEPARREPDPSQSVLWDDDELWVQPARRRGPGEAPAPAARRPAAAAPASAAPASAGRRRTVHISTSSAAPAAAAERRPLREIEPRRPRENPIDRISYDPDRIAMWAVVLGILLVLIAASSSMT